MAGILPPARRHLYIETDASFQTARHLLTTVSLITVTCCMDFGDIINVVNNGGR